MVDFPENHGAEYQRPTCSSRWRGFLSHSVTHWGWIVDDYETFLDGFPSLSSYYIRYRNLTGFYEQFCTCCRLNPAIFVGHPPMHARASGTSTRTHYLDLCENRAPKNRMVEKPVFPTVLLRVSTPFEQTAMGISTSIKWVYITPVLQYKYQPSN